VSSQLFRGNTRISVGEITFWKFYDHKRQTHSHTPRPPPHQTPTTTPPPQKRCQVPRRVFAFPLLLAFCSVPNTGPPESNPCGFPACSSAVPGKLDRKLFCPCFRRQSLGFPFFSLCLTPCHWIGLDQTACTPEFETSRPAFLVLWTPSHSFRLTKRVRFCTSFWSAFSSPPLLPFSPGVHVSDAFEPWWHEVFVSYPCGAGPKPPQNLALEGVHPSF